MKRVLGPGAVCGCDDHEWCELCSPVSSTVVETVAIDEEPEESVEEDE